ncbi:MAG: cell division protein ZapD [Gammaproteobacteria bacterium]|nr:cell division protein ZapD [Gammaproteobacteria bacterium]
MSSHIVYEQPLNERVRTFLRIEHLFDLVQHYRDRESEWDNRLTIVALLDILDLLGRSDVKNELMKELERHSTTLSALQRNPGVDQERLHSILQDINNIVTTLRDGACQPGQALRKDELVGTIKQRVVIASGTCNFDLPGYHHWLNKPVELRKARLDEWQQDLTVVRRGLKLALHMIRNSTTPTRERAGSGFFQRPIEANVACQMIRVLLSADSRYFPEISGGRHRFTVRFMEQQRTLDRPVQTEDDVDFELHCCIL